MNKKTEKIKKISINVNAIETYMEDTNIKLLPNYYTIIITYMDEIEEEYSCVTKDFININWNIMQWKQIISTIKNPKEGIIKKLYVRNKITKFIIGYKKYEFKLCAMHYPIF